MNASSAERARKSLATGRRPAGPLTMFFRGFLKNPVMVGSIIPSSRQLIDRMLKPVDWANTKLFVEYGPGVGTFCRPILDRLPADGMLIAIDTNPDFIAYLRATILDPRFHAVEGSAAIGPRFTVTLSNTVAAPYRKIAHKATRGPARPARRAGRRRRPAGWGWRPG